MCGPDAHRQCAWIIKRTSPAAADRGGRERRMSWRLPRRHAASKPSTAHGSPAAGLEAPRRRRSSLRRQGTLRGTLPALWRRTRSSGLRRCVKPYGDVHGQPSMRARALRLAQWPSRRRPGGTAPRSRATRTIGRTDASCFDRTANRARASRHCVACTFRCMRMRHRGAPGHGLHCRRAAALGAASCAD